MQGRHLEKGTCPRFDGLRRPWCWGTGPLFGPVLVEHGLGGDDSLAARCGKDRRERHTAMSGSRWCRD